MRHWIQKFACAFRGIGHGAWGQTSFAVHLPIALAVLVLAWLLQCLLWQWCVLALCIGLVLSAELANSAIEELARAISRDSNPHIGRSLDIASGAVLVASVVAAAIGLTIFLQQALLLWSPGLLYVR